MIDRSVAAALIAATAVLAVTPALKRLAISLEAVAHPKADRWHTRAVPLLGGAGIAIGITVALVAVGTRFGPLWPVVATSGGMFLLGLVDDIVKLKAVSKLVGQIVIACLFPLLGGASSWLGPPILDGAAAIAWVVAITNAINLLDNMDGLCAGVAAIAAVGCWIELAPASPNLAIVAAAMVGATTAFLVFNFKPASIFMGDAGSLLLGSGLAGLSISADRGVGAGVASAIAVPVFLLLIPLFDTAFVTMSRILSTRAASQGGRDHTSHRLVAMGFSERQAVLLIWMLAAAGGSVALVSRYVSSFAAAIVAPLLLVTLALLGIQLARVSVYDGDDFSRLVGRAYTPLLVEVTYRRRLFEILLDAVLITCAYGAAYVLRFDRDTHLYYAWIRQSLPIVIGCQLLALLVTGVYRGTWEYISLGDLTTYVKGLVLGVFATVMALVYLFRFEGYSRGVFAIDLLLLGVLVIGSRLSFRVLGDAAGRRRHDGNPTLVYGAGAGGAVLVRELRGNPAHALTPVGFIDDDPSKRGKRMMRLPVLGALDALPGIIGSLGIEVVAISTRKLPPERIRTIEAVCHTSGTRLVWLQFTLEERAPARRQAE
jgi:UDP-GlcNAc:undecaprenyl-phosphate GlcNAc-1-phosphate transferase